MTDESLQRGKPESFFCMKENDLQTAYQYGTKHTQAERAS
jgi:hypothetical protein